MGKSLCLFGNTLQHALGAWFYFSASGGGSAIYKVKLCRDYKQVLGRAKTCSMGMRQSAQSWASWCSDLNVLGDGAVVNYNW